MSSIVVIADSSSGSVAEISIEHGFNCYAFRAQLGDRCVDVMDARPDFPQTGERPSGNGTPLLFPFPNRINRGKFEWDGREYHLPLRPGMPHAIHGFALDRPWRVTQQTPDSVTAEFQLSKDAPDRLPLWPADGLIQVQYRVHRATLRLDVRVFNPDTRPLPFGFGTHTYFKLPLEPGGDAGRCLIQARAAEQWVLQEAIPTGERRPVPAAADLREGARFADLKLDDVLTALEFSGDSFDCVLMDESAGLEVLQQFGPGFRELVAFTPSWSTAVCLEPYTCATDAINLESRGIAAGWRVLAPGEEWRESIQISARPILV
ncbi:MAG: aldose 1-epimerase [Planctomycetaceae bacterium]